MKKKINTLAAQKYLSGKLKALAAYKDPSGNMKKK